LRKYSFAQVSFNLFFNQFKLIQSGGEIQAVDNDGNSALHAAAAHGKSLSVNALISRGADTQATNHDGQTALFGALQSGSLSTVKNLADNASPEELFHQVI
jgi:ankyrin repeat protein